MKLTMGKSPKEPKSGGEEKPGSPEPEPQPFTRRMLGLPDTVWAVLDKLGSRNFTNASEEIRTCIRERLERLSLWPPKDKSSE